MILSLALARIGAGDHLTNGAAPSFALTRIRPRRKAGAENAYREGGGCYKFYQS